MRPVRARCPFMLPLILLALLWMAASPCAAGIDPSGKRAEPAPRLPIERVTSELVLIEAYVTDFHGLPIEGLQPKDFVLAIDGRVKPISSLEFLKTGPIAHVVDASSGHASVPPGTEAPSSTISRRLVLFFDDAPSVPQGMMEARRAAAEFLATDLSPSDEVAIVDFDGSLRVLHRFTSDKEDVRNAVLQTDSNRTGPRRRPAIDFGQEAVDLGTALSDQTLSEG